MKEYTIDYINEINDIIDEGIERLPELESFFREEQDDTKQNKKEELQ